MSWIMKKVTGDQAFRIGTFTTLIFLGSFFAAVICSLVLFTSWPAFLSTLFSTEIKYAIKLSLFCATIATAFAMAVAVPAAYAISRTEFRGKVVLDTILDLPVIISPVALGAALLIFFGTSPGRVLQKAFTAFEYQIAGIVLAQFTVISALALRLMKSTFDGIDPRYERVARTLGCSKARAFFTVTLPIARNGLLATCVMIWSRAIGEYGATVTLAGASRVTETLPVAIFLNLESVNIEKAVSVIFILVGIAVGALIVLKSLGTRTVSYD